MKKIAPYLVLISLTLASCTNREILHGSFSDKPPSLKLAKKQTPASVVKPEDAKSEPLKKDSDSKKEAASSLTESEKSASGENADKGDAPESAETAVQTAKSPSKEGTMRIWFARENKGSVQPYAVEREIDKKEPLRSAVKLLLDGPTDAERKSGVKSEVPVGTVLISLKKKDNVVELNLSKRFAAGGVDSIETRLQQLQLTIKEVAGHDRVFLDVEGKRLTSAGDGLEVKQPLNL